MKKSYFKKPGFLKQGEDLLYNPTISSESDDKGSCCCIDFEDLPKDIVPFTQNTLRPETGYTYLSNTYHYVFPPPSHGSPDQLCAELDTYSMGHRGKELFRQKIEELVGILIKTCPDFLLETSKKSGVIDYTRPIWKAPNLRDVVPLSFATKVGPELNKYILEHATNAMNALFQPWYSVVYTIYFNVSSICLEVDENSSNIRTFILADYFWPLDEVKIHHQHGDARKSFPTQIYYLNLQGEVKGTQKFYEATGQLVLEGVPLL